MKPLCIDFAPSLPVSARLRWIVGVAGIVVALVGAAAWVLTGPVEASHMMEDKRVTLPSSEAAQAADRAIRMLNLPWPALLATLAETFGPDHDAVLIHAEADVARGTLRLSGEARSPQALRALPQRLRSAPTVAGVTLLAEEHRAGEAWPLYFTLELRIREGA